jgi:hypothetical protein
MSKSVVPGLRGAAAQSQRNSFEKWLLGRVKARKEARLKLARAEMLRIVEDLAENGPAWTGASAGRPDRAVAPLTKHHPAFGMTIGNVITGGESGWQIIESARRKGSQVVLTIVNPMWDHYLKFVEFGVAPFQKHKGHFVRDAWGRHLQRRGR